MTETALLVDRPSLGVTVLTLNRPDAMNAIDMALAARLFAALDEAEQDPEARCVVLAGAGERAFSSGFDIHELATFDDAAMREAFVYRDPLMLRLAQHRLPVIAAIEGIAYGAGALLAAAADLRVASTAARFKVTATAYDGANATWSLPPLVGMATAKEILMTGRVVEAGEGAVIGLYNRVTEPGQALAAALELAGAIAANPPGGVAGIKRLVGAAQSLAPAEGWQAEHDFMLASLARGAKGGDAVFAGFLGKHPRGGA